MIAVIRTTNPDQNQWAASAAARVARCAQPSVGSTQHPGLSESRLGRLRSPPSGADKRGRSAPPRGRQSTACQWAKSTGCPCYGPSEESRGEGERSESGSGKPTGFNGRDSGARLAAVAWESALRCRPGSSLRYDAADTCGLRLVRGAIRLSLRLAYRRVEVVGPSASPLPLVDPMLMSGTVPRRLTVPVVGHR
jgi:hypothetical protein